MFCPNCGSRVADGIAFCDICGFKLEEPASKIKTAKEELSFASSPMSASPVLKEKTSQKRQGRQSFPVMFLLCTIVSLVIGASVVVLEKVFFLLYNDLTDYGFITDNVFEAFIILISAAVLMALSAFMYKKTAASAYMTAAAAGLMSVIFFTIPNWFGVWVMSFFREVFFYGEKEALTDWVNLLTENFLPIIPAICLFAIAVCYLAGGKAGKVIKILLCIAAVLSILLMAAGYMYVVLDRLEWILDNLKYEEFNIIEELLLTLKPVAMCISYLFLPLGMIFYTPAENKRKG